MTTTAWLEAQIKPLRDALSAIVDGKDPKAAAKKRKPIAKQLDKLEAMCTEQRKYKGER